MKKRIFNKKINERGLSIIETIVAVLILSFVMGAPLAVLQKGLQFSQFAKERVEARFLLVEELEYLRNLKDSAVILAIREIEDNPGMSPSEVTSKFNTVIMGACPGGSDRCYTDVFDHHFNGDVGIGKCGVDGGEGGFCDYEYNDSVECSNPDLIGCEREYGNSASGITYNNSSKYTRKLEIDLRTPDELKIEVDLFWNDRNGDLKNIRMGDILKSYGFH